MPKKYNILLIEQAQELANTIIHWLKHKANLVHVSNNYHAQEEASLGGWDLVITDINSPEMNDLDIIQIVKSTDVATPILIITENKKVDFILTAMKYHADGLFFKPLDKNEVTKRVVELIHESFDKKEYRKKIILTIGAHPDDVEFGCAGTLAKFSAEGSQINILTLSLGAAGGNPKIRKQESQKAAKFQQARLFLGNLQDTKISDAVTTIKYLEEIIDKVKPTHVYTHSVNDNHQDHRNIFQATVIACRQIPNIFSYLSPSSTVDFRPNIFINIDEFMKKKLEVISMFSSQMDTRAYMQPEMILATARYWGRFCNYHLVEPMEVIKEHS